ncbi:MAG: hypothetical protein ACRDIL_16175 [Candidatus Limnocylindrales bacterium]
MTQVERHTIEFGDLAESDTLVVTDNLNAELVRTTDPSAISAATAWLCERADGWYQPDGGPRVMKIRLNFSAGGRPLGNVGIGRRYLTAHRRGEFAQRDADDGAEVLALVGYEPPQT